MIKKIALLLMVVAFAMNAEAATKIKTTKDSTSYAFGYLMGSQQLNTLIEKYGCNKELFLKAMQDALNRDASVMTTSKAEEIMHKTEQAYLTKQNSAKENAYQLAKVDNEKYLKEIKNNKAYFEIPNSWDSTSCGVLRKVVKTGFGEKPTISSAVKFNYCYKLTNGTVISQSKKGEPIEGLVRNLLPGLQDALVEMPVGSKWELVIPSELAFDRDEQFNEDGSVMVPANSILVFELELVNTGTPEAIDYYGGE